ncbi:hypothetical protein PUNSTDRAFT_139053 [Punctularia strigosozonata HHB-11173 SS5]|uniref:Ribosomal RNA methyltransferase FtsJ domain-containing protein n=1 Tax=Punctularia strigosozonata (strain HHB-11173) TaxID=741275 RepID=R7S445_PUNST|nr:uncharacterized protein PUNSTDRAFT_139053 [Punctularia strigosozonata HHB-11173 SS5]EIN04011.1 hypothetical protein PUNSTDRAFT_139053 [Punctularia strigosozonata HHB-11173 SS5]
MSRATSPVNDMTLRSPTNFLQDGLLSRPDTVDTFQQLHALRRQCREKSELDRHFKRTEAAVGANRNDSEAATKWIGRMKSSFMEIDNGTKFIDLGRPMKFLDLGCCPGGSASYILERHQSASGIGVSLESERGLQTDTLDRPPLPNRLEMRFGDMLSWYCGPLSSSGNHSSPPFDGSESLVWPPFSQSRRLFNLVVIHAHYISRKGAEPLERDRLLVSQLIIALQAVRIGGTLLVKLARADSPAHAKIIRMLDDLSLVITLWKPTTMQANRGSFYVVAKGVGLRERGRLLGSYLTGLRRVWLKLYRGRLERNGDQRMSDADLNFVITNEKLVDGYLPRLVTLCNPIWRRQIGALRGMVEPRNARAHHDRIPHESVDKL